jgi:pentose-5-phosphate-3-epimerase
MDKVDIILLMSVNPGFGGQKFIPNVLEKAKEARKLIDESVGHRSITVFSFFHFSVSCKWI